MTKLTEVCLPDIGDFDEVEIIEILVASGDRVDREDSLITLESDKATMEIPSPAAGIVKDIRVTVGDKIAQGAVILVMQAQDDSTAAQSTSESKSETDKDTTQPDVVAESAMPAVSTAGTFEKSDKHADVLVLGSGPGGYTAAFRAADLGRQVIMIERHQRIGGSRQHGNGDIAVSGLNDRGRDHDGLRGVGGAGNGTHTGSSCRQTQSQRNPRVVHHDRAVCCSRGSSAAVGTAGVVAVVTMGGVVSEWGATIPMRRASRSRVSATVCSVWNLARCWVWRA